MSANPLLRFARHRMRWLLAFALLLPLTQVMAVGHQIGHAREARLAKAEAAPASNCGACMLAGAIVAGGAATTVRDGAVASPAPSSAPAFRRLPAPSSPLARPCARGPPRLLA